MSDSVTALFYTPEHEPTILAWIVAIVIAYLWGAVPTGYIAVKKTMGVDLRDYGSGNTGATNVKRVAGNKVALFVLIFDFLKAFLPVVILKELFPTSYILHVMGGFAPVLGHSRSVFLGFKGGKSAISGLGGLMGLALIPSVLLGLLAFTIIKLTRIVSLGSIIAGSLAPVAMFVFKCPFPYTIYGFLTGYYIVYLHRSNITRLLEGRENKI